jgi:hypothetical protein
MSVDLIARALAVAATPIGSTAMAISSLRPASSVTLIQTSGYSVVGIGAGLYVSDALANAALALAQPRICKADGSSPTRYWRLLGDADGVISVTQVGALGDGVTNDRDAILAAVTTGKNVFFPKGAYLVSGGNIQLANSNQTLFGEGWGSKLVGGNAQSLVNIGACDGLTIRDLWLESTVASYATITCFHVDITNLVITRNKITNTAGDGENFTNGIHLVCNTAPVGIDGVEISHNYIPNSRRMGIEVQGGASAPKYRNVKILYNTITDPGQGGIYGQGISLTGQGEHVSVEYNLIEGSTNWSLENAGCSHAKFNHNRVLGSPGVAILVAGVHLMVGGEYTHNLVIGGSCQFGSLYRGLIAHNDLYLTSSGYLTLAMGAAAGSGWNRVVHNAVYTEAVYAFVNDGIGNTTVADNVFDNSAGAANFSTMRFNGVASTYCYAARNQLRFGPGGVFWDEAGGATNNTFDDNVLRGATLARSNLMGGEKIVAVTYDPPSLADGAGVTTTVTVPGVALLDFAIASFGLDTQGIIVSAAVTAANTVTVRFQNETGGTIDLGSSNLFVRTFSALAA